MQPLSEFLDQLPQIVRVGIEVLQCLLHQPLARLGRGLRISRWRRPIVGFVHAPDGRAGLTVTVELDQDGAAMSRRVPEERLIRSTACPMGHGDSRGPAGPPFIPPRATGGGAAPGAIPIEGGP